MTKKTYLEAMTVKGAALLLKVYRLHEQAREASNEAWEAAMALAIEQLSPEQ